MEYLPLSPVSPKQVLEPKTGYQELSPWCRAGPYRAPRHKAGVSHFFDYSKQLSFSLHDLPWVPKGRCEQLLIKGGAAKEPPVAGLSDQRLEDLTTWGWAGLVAQSCLTLCNPMGYSPPGSSVHGILQARILEGVAMPSSRGSSQPRDRTQVSHIAGRFFMSEPLGKPLRGWGKPIF